MKIFLCEKDIIGRGMNKIVYYHPKDKNKCIKFSLNNSDETDIQYEIKFRKSCKQKVEQSELLTKYFGIVETNLGRGYVFELVRDFDGELSETFETLLRRDIKSPKVFEVLEMFKEKLFEEVMIISPIFSNNILVQKISEQEIRIRIVDGIGMHVLLPIPYYSKTFAIIHLKKMWRRFMKLLREEYGLPSEV